MRRTPFKISNILNEWEKASLKKNTERKHIEYLEQEK